MIRSVLVRALRGLAARLANRGVQYLADRYPQYEIGRGSYGDLTVLGATDEAVLKMGAYCSAAAGVTIFLGAEHRTDWATTYPFSVLDPQFRRIAGHPRTRGDVVIGNDVWLAHEAVVLSGVTIGDGAVVGARAVVRNDVPPYAIVAGNPAVVQRYRFPPETIARLTALAWWDWPPEKLQPLIPLMLDRDLDAFLTAAERSGAGR